MKLWGQKQESNGAVGGEFEEAAARVTAEEQPARVPTPGEGLPDEEESLEIRPEWAEAAARLCFLPAARLSHPAYTLTDEEAEIISPKMQAFLQAVADKYAPALVGRVANKYPEFFDLTAALGVLYWQKWRYVSRLRQLEASDRAQKEAEHNPAPESVELPGVVLPMRPKVGERTADGALVI
jgi:hypothetical protein